MNKLCLPDVMLCAVTSVALEQTLAALERSLAQVDFGRVLLCSDRNPDISPGSNIEWRPIEAIGTREAYSRFILKDLVRHVTLPHVLIVQWDGFVLNAKCWQENFTKYDYVGAVWPQFDDYRVVGNGGFSLRSLRLLEATSSDRYSNEHPEDIAICRKWRAALEDEGIRFAPPEIARKFAFERESPLMPTFGFHGLFNFPEVLDRVDCQKIIDGLAGDLLVGRDGADLAQRFVDLGQVCAAWRVVVRRVWRLKWSWWETKAFWRILNTTIIRLSRG